MGNNSAQPGACGGRKSHTDDNVLLKPGVAGGGGI